MEETLEKEILEEEKNSSKTIFESELFKNVYGGLTDASKGELRNEVRNILLEGMKKFVEVKTCNPEPINWEAVEIAYFAGVATALGGDVSRIAREKSLEEARTEIMKRVIRKDNFIGFDIYFDGDNKPTGAAIFPKEQYEDLLKRGQTLEEIIKQTVSKDKKDKIKSITVMDSAKLDGLLEVSANKMLEGEEDE